MADSFTDHFGAVSRRYVESRPAYPPALFEWLAALVADRAQAWDCGAGNGQASIALAAHFDRVIATDASASQLAQAIAHPRVTYRVASADASGLRAEAVSLVSVAQALHWFPLDAFYAEVRRVLKPAGVVAAWTYGAFRLPDAQADAIVRAYHYGTVAAYWPSERAHVENGYRELQFPFARIEAPGFAMETSWTLSDVAGYLRSWSATARYVSEHGHDPVAIVERELRDIWLEPERPVRVEWPLTVLAGRRA